MHQEGDPMLSAAECATALPGHGVDPWRYFLDGIRQALSRGAPGPPRDGRRLLDGSHSGHQRTLRAVRRRHKPRHARGSHAEG